MERNEFITEICSILEVKPDIEQLLQLVDLYNDLTIKPLRTRSKAKHFSIKEKAYMEDNRGKVKHKDMAVHLACSFRQVTNYFYMLDNN